MHPKRLIVVAQDPGLLASLEFSLAAEGFAVTSSATLAGLDPASCDLAILDHQTLRVDQPTTEAFLACADRVIVLGDDPQKPRRTKPVHYVQKPLRGNELLTAINIALVDVA